MINRRNKFRLFQLIGIVAIMILSIICFIVLKNGTYLQNMNITRSKATGSKEINANGGYRPYLEYRNDFTAGIQRKSIIYVYAKSGETLYLGSSAMGIGTNGGITYTSPTGTAFQCSGNNGRINNYNQEQNGPRPNGGGYTPCTRTLNSTETGIWQIDFISPDPSDAGNPPPILASTAWSQPNNVSYVSSWDVTVRNSSGSEIKGRAFAKYLSLNIGGNSVGANPILYTQTKDGYLYRVNLNAIDPFGFIFFSNNKGIVNGSGVQTYKSLQLSGNNPEWTLPAGYSIHSPSTPDTTFEYTNKIFFETPSADLPQNAASPTGIEWLINPIVYPANSPSLTFVGIDGTLNQAGTQNLGGYFEFNSSSVSDFDVMLDVDNNGVYEVGVDRVISGRSTSGLNRVFWDGRDGLGNLLPPGVQSFRFQLIFKAGEVHFPIIDPENNPNGLIIQRVSPTPTDYSVSYNDTDLTGGTGPSPINALYGVNSTSGAHKWSNSFGDGKIMDTWTFLKSTNLLLTGTVTLRESDVSIVKTQNPNTPTYGSPITYTLTINNSSTGGYNAPNVNVTDTVPPQITNVTWACSITLPGSGTTANSCQNPTGAGNNINTQVSLNSGAQAKIIVSGTVSPSASGTIMNTATVNRGLDTGDPNLANNTSSTSFFLADRANLSLIKTTNGAFISGNTVKYNLKTTNNGPQTALAPITIVDTLPSGIQYLSFNNAAGSTGWSCTQNLQIITCTNQNSLSSGAFSGVELNVKIL